MPSTISPFQLEKTQVQTRNFRKLSEGSWEDQALSSLDKHLIAVAVAHSTNCQHCLIFHAEAAKKDGATLDQLLEVSYVASVANILSENVEQISEDLEIPNLSIFIQSSEINYGIQQYLNSQLNPIHISKQLKILSLIAIYKFKGSNNAVNHLIKIAFKLNVDNNQIDEALKVAVVLSSGIVFSNNLKIAQLFQ